jgi:hypothetical protein
LPTLTVRNFFFKLFHWEHWPFGIIQFPVFIMWIGYAIRERSLFYFSASNPGILAGGMMGESKFDVLELIPETVKPKTLLVKQPSSLLEIVRLMQQSRLAFPVIFKPDMGERGWMVRKVHTEQEIEKYLSEIKTDFIIQEWVNLPMEFGVYYLRFPNQKKGFVNSITMKEFLFVEGDGAKTLEQLILEKDRARLQWKSLKTAYQKNLHEVLPKGKKVELVSIGNHCLGTTFINGNHLITAKLSESFDRISQQVKGFYFGRYDLRCGSLKDLEEGRVMILELNGCGAEPSHIYHPGRSLWRGISDLVAHWKNMHRISKENYRLGVPYLSFREGREIYRRFVSRKK